MIIEYQLVKNILCKINKNISYTYRKETITGTSIGLLLFVASRVWLRSFVPAWWDCHSNVIVFTICMIATLDAIYDSFTSAPPPPSSSSPPPPTPPQPPQRSTNWVIVSFCFGSLLYTTHALYGEASVLTRWTVQGFPHTGPMPFPMGLVTHFTLSSHIRPFCCLPSHLYSYQLHIYCTLFFISCKIYL